MEETHAAVTVNDTSFTQEVLAKPGVVVVDFWAPWCGPCTAMAPIIDQLAQHYREDSQVTVTKLNVDENGQTAMTFQIMSIPNLKLFVDGAVVDEAIGVTPLPILQQKVEQARKRLPQRTT